MIDPRLDGGLLVLLSVALTSAACQPAGDGHDGEALAAVSSRLEATQQRLTAIETKLDALTTTLQDQALALEPLTAWAAERKAQDETHEARRRERGAMLRPDARPNPAGTSSSELKAATEGIQCEGLETAKIECKVDRALLDDLMDDPAKLARQARIVPKQEGGSVVGYKFYGIRSGSLPKRLGIENGDMLTAVDGKALTSIDQAMEIYAGLRTATRIELSLERRGKAIALVVEFVE
ncbi:MAG: hypothetical protein AAGF11_01810 [Myxococcota bacterium]